MSERNTLDKPNNPFRLDERLFTSLPRPFSAALQAAMERGIGLDWLARGYERLAETDTPDAFAAQTLQYLNIAPRIIEGGIENIPASGPVVVVANHPLGGIEGVIMTLLTRLVRSDVRIIANGLLKRIPELSDTIIGITPHAHAHENLRPLREAVRWLKNGGLLVVFPVEAPSTPRLDDFTRREANRVATVARLVRMSGAQVVPVHIGGRNSLLFRSLGRLHPRLRTLMLPWELAGKRNRVVELRVGEANAPPSSASFH